MSYFVVTGAAGFVGARVAGMLLESGHEVTGVDSLHGGGGALLTAWRLEQLARFPRFRFERADVRSEAIWSLLGSSRGGEPLDAVFHLAARTGIRASVVEPAETLDTNVLGTLAVLRGAAAAGARAVVLASSSSVYGEGAPIPYCEDAPLGLPLSPYAVSKRAAEGLACVTHQLSGLNVAVLRYFTVYGPAGRPDMSPLSFARAIAEGDLVRLTGDGSQSRDFTYVDDVARGTVAAAGLSGFSVLNLGTGRAETVGSLVERLERLTGCAARVERVPSHPADMTTTVASTGRARELLGWTATVGLDEGLERLVSWYRANRSWASTLGVPRPSPTP